jgi:Holliday junction DNA helicase RuvA
MIASISGKVSAIESNSLVVDLGGIGVQVFVPVSLKERLHTGEGVFLFTTLVVRQDALSLYGFDTRENREYFNLLLTVNGIGPRLALSVLSTLSPDAIRRAIFHEQAEVFSRVPGVGKKNAQKIMLTLQDKIKAPEGLEPIVRISDADAQVLEALTTLGYSVVEAQAALQSIPSDAPQDVEERLRLALQYFSSY